MLELAAPDFTGLPFDLLHTFACDCAQRALLAAEDDEEMSRATFNEAWEALEIKRRWIQGEASDNELEYHRQRICELIILQNDSPEISVYQAMEAVSWQEYLPFSDESSMALETAFWAEEQFPDLHSLEKQSALVQFLWGVVARPLRKNLPRSLQSASPKVVRDIARSAIRRVSFVAEEAARRAAWAAERSVLHSAEMALGSDDWELGYEYEDEFEEIGGEEAAFEERMWQAQHLTTLLKSHPENPKGNLLKLLLARKHSLDFRSDLWVERYEDALFD